MPIIKIEMFEGRSIEQKRELVKSLTQEMARICATPAQGIYVIIDEIKKENWGISGALCADLYPDNKS